MTRKGRGGKEVVLRGGEVEWIFCLGRSPLTYHGQHNTHNTNTHPRTHNPLAPQANQRTRRWPIGVVLPFPHTLCCGIQRRGELLSWLPFTVAPLIQVAPSPSVLGHAHPISRPLLAPRGGHLLLPSPPLPRLLGAGGPGPLPPASQVSVWRSWFDPKDISLLQQHGAEQQRRQGPYTHHPSTPCTVD